MTAADTLTAWGVLRAGDVVDIARAIGLDVALAAALLEQESGGGRNVWGSDAVPTGGTYVKGAGVTRSTYAAYRIALASRTAGQQGVGPCQLTSVSYQDQADRLGGCWSPGPNMRVGFAVLKGYVDRWGPGPALRAYNGGAGTVTDPARYPSPAAHAYERSAMAKLARWRDRLGPLSATAPAAATSTPEDDDMTPDERSALFELRDLIKASKPGVRLPGRSAGLANTVDDEFGWTMTAAGIADITLAELRGLAGKVGDGTTIDYGKLARAIVAELAGKVTP